MLILDSWLAAAGWRDHPRRCDCGEQGSRARRTDQHQVGAEASREDLRIPIQGIRKSTADAMVHSASPCRTSRRFWMRCERDHAAGGAAQDSA